jgi:hypothetical protein
MPPSTRASLKAHHALPLSRTHDKTRNIAPARVKMIRAAAVTAAVGKARAVKTQKSAIQGGIFKTPAHSKRAPSAAAASPASAQKSPKPAASSANAIPKGNKSVPGSKGSARCATSPEAPGLPHRRPIRASAFKQAAQSPHPSASAKQAPNQSKPQTLQETAGCSQDS